MHDPIAFTYEADTHCPECADERFGRDEYGDINGIDNEGNSIGVIAPWDEWDRTISCGTCGVVIKEGNDDE